MASPSTATVELDAQYRVLRETAGWVERVERGVLVVRGAEAAEYLQGQLTNDVEALAPGQGCYAALLDRKGHMQGDLVVSRRDETEFVLNIEGAGLDAVARHLGMYRIGRDADVENITGDHAVVSVVGPAARDLLGFAPLVGEGSCRDERLGDVTCLAVATAEGIDLLLGRGGLEDLVAGLTKAGVEAVTEEACEILRVETGRPRFGREMTTATIPQEAGINDRAVSFTKGCYIGQETVARLHYKGKPNRSLRGLRLAATATAGDPIVLDGKELGAVGTAVLSPAHGPIALAIVRREAQPGARVVVGDANEAEVVELPF